MKYKFEKGSRVNFKNNRVPRFVNEISKKAKKHGISMYITSAYRSPYDQARVVCNNFHSTEGANMSIYGTKTQQMYRDYCPTNDLTTLEQYEKEQLERRLKDDPKYQGHATGDAVDLSVKNLTYDQKLILKDILEKSGAEVLWEKHPEHFHVWLRDWNSKSRFFYFGIGIGLVALIPYLIKINK